MFQFKLFSRHATFYIDLSCHTDLSVSGVNSTIDKFSMCSLDIYSTARLLQQIKSDSAMGPDEIPAFILKKLAPYLASNIMHLFNSSISTGAFPSEWKKANVSSAQ